MRTLIVIVGATLLAGCGGSDSASNDATAAASTPVASPPHNWINREGDEYGYAAALSEDQEKAGQAAGEVTMFRYLGQSGAVYTVASETPSGWLAYASCTNPCQVIKLVGPGTIQRVVFNPNSVVGGALTDAFNGQLEVYGDSAADRAEAAKEAATQAASSPPPPLPSDAVPAAPAAAADGSGGFAPEPTEAGPPPDRWDGTDRSGHSTQPNPPQDGAASPS